MRKGEMLMNRSKIEWCDHTWNPITGCRHECSYCYARTMTARFAGDVRLNKMAKADYQMVDAADGSEPLYFLEKPMLNETGNPLVYPFGFEPTYHRYRMNTLDKLKMGNNIFVGAMADVFGAWVPEQWILDILNVCEERPQHNYMFLTKNPERYSELQEAGKLPKSDNLWYGATVTNAAQLERTTRVFADLPDSYHTFFSIEPIFEDIAEAEIWKEAILETDWIIIGAQTGRRKNKVVPEMGWIRKIVVSADTAYCIPVFMKDSLLQIVGEKNMRRDFPKELQRKTVSKKMQNKLYAECAKCKAYLKKSDMVTLLARSKRGEQPKQFGFMCKKCFREFCKELGIDIPALAEFAKEADVSVTFEPNEENVDG